MRPITPAEITAQTRFDHTRQETSHKVRQIPRRLYFSLKPVAIFNKVGCVEEKKPYVS